VFTFVAEFEKITFREARELLARRAGINLEGSPAENVRRGKLLDTIVWAEKAYQECLLESELGERARLYIAERKLAGPTVRQFGLGYAPAAGDWLVRMANAARLEMDLLKEVGLVAERAQGSGFYDRFRDRVMFPIRDARGQAVGFGGRILPNSPFAERGPKYYNSSETPLFLKKDLLHGRDDGPPARGRPRGGHHGHGPERGPRPSTAALRAAGGARVRRGRGRGDRCRPGP
jgi:DNA primase